MSEVGENIRKRRQYLNMTQEQLAEKMGYADKGMISRIENGKIGLSKKKIEKFAEILRISPVELMGYVFEPEMQVKIDELMEWEKQYGPPPMPEEEISRYANRDALLYAANNLTPKNLEIAAEFCTYLLDKEEKGGGHNVV